MSVAERLKELDIELPRAQAALAAYVPAVLTGNLLYIAGQGPIADNEVKMRGRLGENLSEKQGIEAARMAAVNAMAVMAEALGSLDRVARIVKLNGYVNSAPDFERQHVVINGASELLLQVFGERGRHARAAVGTNVLPMGMPVEIELVVEITPDS
jgi:enamine deaminase RidA (YjgF/YER057c/UK114 family)